MRKTGRLDRLITRASAAALMTLVGLVSHSEPVAFREVAKGNFASSFGGWGVIVPPRECVFTNEGDFALYWTNSWRPPPNQMPPGTTPENFPVPSLPPVDWNTEMVIALSKGTSPNLRHKIWVEAIERTETNLFLSVFHQIGEAVSDQFLIPFQIVATAKVALPVAFRLRSELKLRLDPLDEPPNAERVYVQWSNLGTRFSYVLEGAPSVSGPWSELPYQTWPTTNIFYSGVLPKASQRFIKFTVLEAPGPIESCMSP